MLNSKSHRPPGRPRFDETEQPTDAMILKAASRLFLDNGYKEVSIDDVARACGVTKATVYYYFPSKAELFTETMIQMMDRIRARILSILQEDIPLRERLLKVTEAHLTATLDVDLEGFMRGTKNSLSAIQIKKMREAEEKMYQAIEKTFSEAIANGEIREINPTFAAHTYVSLLKVGNYRDAENQGIFSSSELAAGQIVDFFWNGLFPG